MSGLSRTPGKRVQDNILTGVRIPPLRQDTIKTPFPGVFFFSEMLKPLLLSSRIPLIAGRGVPCYSRNRLWLLFFSFSACFSCQDGF